MRGSDHTDDHRFLESTLEAQQTADLEEHDRQRGRMMKSMMDSEWSAGWQAGHRAGYRDAVEDTRSREEENGND